jgi:hypothetical protein
MFMRCDKINFNMPRKKEKNKRDEDKKDKKYEKRERDTLEQ